MRWNSLVVLVPTCCDDLERLYLAHALASLAFQEMPFDHMRLVVRDEGRISAMSSRPVRQLWDLLERKGFETLYVRRTERKGIGLARRELVENYSGQTDLLLFLDDDMILEPSCIARLAQALATDPEAGFAQGAKIELDAGRTYWNDINNLNREEVGEPRQIMFGDAALLLIRRRAIEAVSWDVVARFSTEGLAGEDVALTLMMAERCRGWGVPQARGWHLSPAKERWRWEPATDLLQVHILKEVVSRDTLKAALPHLRDQIDRVFDESNDDALLRTEEDAS